MENVKLELSKEEVNAILMVLAEKQLKDVFGLFVKIKNQAEEQEQV